MTISPTRSAKNALHPARLVLPVVAGALVVWLGWPVVASLDLAQLAHAFSQIKAWQWILATACIAFSFAAIGQYDAIWHKHFKTQVPPRLARQTGMAAVAIGQVVGMGAVTGGLVRWQTLTMVPFAQVAKVSAAVAASFVVAWAILAGLVSPALFDVPMWCLFIGGIALAAAYLSAHRSARGLLPAPKQLLHLMTFTALDLMFAGTALFVLLPETIDIGYPVLIAAFVTALGLGLISNVPAGAGVLELTLVTLIAPDDIAALMAGLLAFRVVGYGLPAIVAALWVAIVRIWPAALPPDRAGEWDLVHQHGKVVRTKTSHWFMGHPLGVPVTIGSATCITPPKTALGCYKTNSRTAATLRRQGWSVARIASEAILAPHDWAPTGKSFSQLRRKLKSARASGVTVSHTANLPIDAMSKIAADWAVRSGGELGFSMGRYDPCYITRQKVFLIHHDGVLVGFVSFQAHGSCWTLDLMRYARDAPDGAMHLAIHDAICTAGRLGVARLSLAATPDCHLSLPRWLTPCGAGLTQFKKSFRPKWSPRFHAARGPIGFAATLAATTIAIQRPIPRAIQVFALKMRR